MGLTKCNIGALDLYLASDPGSSLTHCLLKIVKDLVNFRLGLGMSHIGTKEQSDHKSRVFLQVLYDNKGMDKIGHFQDLALEGSDIYCPTEFSR